MRRPTNELVHLLQGFFLSMKKEEGSRETGLWRGDWYQAKVVAAKAVEEQRRCTHISRDCLLHLRFYKGRPSTFTPLDWYLSLSVGLTIFSRGHRGSQSWIQRAINSFIHLTTYDHFGAFTNFATNRWHLWYWTSFILMSKKGFWERSYMAG